MQSSKKIPQRKCMGCGEMFDKNNLIRVCKNNEKGIFLDYSNKAEGRGAYICKNPDCLNKAVKARRFERSFKCAFPAGVYELLLKELESSDNR